MAGRRAITWVIALGIFMLAAQAAGAAKRVVETMHRGIHLTAMALPAAGADIVLMNPADGVANLKKAIDRIYAASSFSADHLETLKRNGKVTVVYDARFPNRELSSVKIAAFFPDFFQKGRGGLKQFLVVIGRFGIKWPVDKLAAVVVHELVGHGLQHLRGFRDKDRELDLECEALIYEENSIQDFAIRRDTEDMVRMRRAMRTHWCSDFGRYLISRNLNVDEVWGYGKPDVPKLLEHFDAYRKHLRRTGVSSRAVAKVKAVRAESFEQFAQQAEKTGSPKDLLSVGHRFLKGIGVKRNARRAAKWVRKSADLGHGPAQHLMGALYAAGHGVKKDRVEAYKWFVLASRRGINASRKNIAKLSKSLTPAQISDAKRRASAWK